MRSKTFDQEGKNLVGGTISVKRSTEKFKVTVEVTNSTERTTNCCESLHSEFIDEFYYKHLNIFNFRRDFRKSNRHEH